MAVEHYFTLERKVFIALIALVAKDSDKGEIFFHYMTLVKDNGYVLENIFGTKTGRDLLASGSNTAK